MIDKKWFTAFLIASRKFFDQRFVKIALSIFTISFAILVLGLLLYREKDALLNYSWEFHFSALLASFVLYIIDLSLVVIVWGLIMRALGSKFGFWQHFRNISISNLAKRLPGTIWYVAWRGDMYHKDGMSLKIVALASGVELVISIFGGAFACIFFAIPILAEYPVGIAALGILFLICLILLHPHVLSKLLKFVGSDINYFSYKSILSWIILYFLIWIIGGGILFSFTNIVYTVDLNYLGYFIGSWSLVGISSFLLFFMPTNMGYNEIGISLLLSVIMPTSFSVVVALLSRALLLIYEIILAVWCWAIEYKYTRI